MRRCVIHVRMNVSFLVVYAGEETIRCWLQTKVKKKQLHIRNDPGKIEAGMKIVDEVRKCILLTNDNIS